jgi:hypothetical protein
MPHVGSVNHMLARNINILQKNQIDAFLDDMTHGSCVVVEKVETGCMDIWYMSRKKPMIAKNIKLLSNATLYTPPEGYFARRFEVQITCHYL